MASVGEVLKRARLDQGLDLETVAARTKISVRYLTAIEADDRKALPSGFFYKSFVEQYARLLLLDTREIDTEVDQLLSLDAPLPLPYANQVSTNVPAMNLSPRFGGGRVVASVAALMVVVLGCSAVYAWWRNAKRGESPSVVVKSEAARNEPAKSASPKQQEVPASPVSPAQPAPMSAPNAQTDVSSTQTVASTPPLSEAPGAQAGAGYKVLLDLMAREETWLSVSSDGKRVFSGILAPNQTKSVAGRESATMKVGNAAGLEVRLNGKLLGPLGARGQVLVVVFTPDDYQIVPPAPRAGD